MWPHRSVPGHISSDLYIFGQYEVIYKASFDLFLSIVPPRHSSEVDWASYIGVEFRFLGYNLATEGVSSLPPSRESERRCYGSVALVSVPYGDMVWFPALGSASMETCLGDWRAVNSGTTYVPLKVEGLSVDVREMVDHGL